VLPREGERIGGNLEALGRKIFKELGTVNREILWRRGRGEGKRGGKDQAEGEEAHPRVGGVFPVGVACQRTELNRQLGHVAAEDWVEKIARVVLRDVRSSFNVTELDGGRSRVICGV
jgi:hypothetical protein